MKNKLPKYWEQPIRETNKLVDMKRKAEKEDRVWAKQLHVNAQAYIQTMHYEFLRNVREICNYGFVPKYQRENVARQMAYRHGMVQYNHTWLQREMKLDGKTGVYEYDEEPFSPIVADYLRTLDEKNQIREGKFRSFVRKYARRGAGFDETLGHVKVLEGESLERAIRERDRGDKGGDAEARKGEGAKAFRGDYEGVREGEDGTGGDEGGKGGEVGDSGTAGVGEESLPEDTGVQAGKGAGSA